MIDFLIYCMVWIVFHAELVAPVLFLVVVWKLEGWAFRTASARNAGMQDEA
jgi:hypothetical protein